ncbi:MAG TPA: hypothetical protein VJS43_15455, partial [Candidatus Acidoferrales bacterium]|nr:hypothetical protein [Candidatus Acidoferrales bacterium]
MRLHFHFAAGGSLARNSRGALCAAALLSAALVCPSAPAAGQSSPSDVVARIQGSDLSINGQLLTPVSTLVSVANGNVVTVHSGEASMRLIDGGEVSVCGPARFTVLANADGAITLALDFGRMHVELPATVSLRVLTPMIVATPIEIEGGKRDVIVGLDQNNSLCVLAATGAVQLEQQFSGQRMIVPQSGDFSLQNGQLVPVVDTGGSCECAPVPMATPGQPPAPETAVAIPPAANTHPVAQSAQEQIAQAPTVAPSAYKIDLPPMVYSSAMPKPPDVPTEETAILIREVRDEPDWEFTGRVEAPDFARAMSRALGESGESPNSEKSPNDSGAQKK